MDIDELRRLIRAAILAVPLTTVSIGCGAAPPATHEPTVGAADPNGAETEPGTEPGADSSTTSSGNETTTAYTPPEDGTMDPGEFDRQWRESLRRPARPDNVPVIMEGRPLVTAQGASLGALRSGRTWTGAASTLAPVDPALASRLARAWIETARAEHASVASFARAALELMAVGAPAELVEAHQRASLDEIEHARMAFALAEAYGVSVAPGPLEVPAPRPASLVQLAHDVFVEGCVNETAAALVAARAARHARDEAVERVLARIAEDEAGHAALAWRTVRWALDQGGAPVRAVIAEIEAPAVRSVTPQPDVDALLTHGVVDAHGQARALEEAWAALVVPLRCELLG